MSYENQFLVLPDAKTIVGVDYLDKSLVMIEDITQGNPRQIGTHGDLISTVLFDSMTQSLLVGDYKGHVKQYKKENGSFTMVKDYGKVGVGEVLSSTQVGRFAIFGGRYFLVAINISEQKVFPEVLKSPFGCTYSLQVCKGACSNVYLSLGGSSPKYCSDVSDFLDVTLLYKGHIPINQFYEKMNQLDSIFQEKDKMINSWNLKIKNFKSSLQKQANQNESKNKQRYPKSKQVASKAK